MAEAEITSFTSRRKADHVTCRLVVRRGKRLNPVWAPTKSVAGSMQEEVFAAYRHHGLITNSTLTNLRVRRPAPRPRDRRAGHRSR